MRSVGHSADMVHMRNWSKILVEEPEEKRPLEELDIDCRIIIKESLKEYFRKICTIHVFIWSSERS
jgi:hypothetical protein